ncbi:nuclear transport factor 2 family protein [Anaerophaga thermohalophila]|uniref:nuclear transport factor 2 family protein n=1 Tax=Anaerophaga thermohalophila TaxID=177400 RepID=UPI0002D2EE6B|nr:nuclear transport factor 2 family protein [Anaerophaga thermohalophila]
MEKTKPAFYNKKSVEAVAMVLEQLLRSQENGDIEAFAGCFLQNDYVVHIGTDIDEFFTTWRSYFHWIENVLDSRKGHDINEKDTRIRISDDGNTAWYSQLIDTCYETKGELTRIEGFRHTGVLIKSPEGWRIVQSHVSVPINPPESPGL